VARRCACIDCRLIEPTPGQWIAGRCPRCNQIAAHRVMERSHGAPGDPATPEIGHETKTSPPVIKIPTPEYVQRPVRHLATLNKRYPHAWQQIDKFREARGKQLEDWPHWCFCPLSGAYAIATDGRNDITPSGVDVAVIGAMAAWRPSQGIYRFDDTLLAELWATPVDGDIPVEVLERLPEWCCYVPLDPPKRALFGSPADPAESLLYGFFVHLEHDIGTHRRELRFLLDTNFTPSPLLPIILHSESGNLTDCIHAAFREAKAQAAKHGYEDPVAEKLIDLGLRASGLAPGRGPSTAEELAQYVAPLVSLTLYLCSTTAEILGRDGQLKPLNRPPLRHTKRGTRMFPPPQASVWEVGFRLGATLRAAAPGISGPDRGGTHATPRPHMRRAHWHAFWTGPKAKPGMENTDRKLVLHWLPPVLVAAESGEVIPTVHRVTK
jgi:hypothetical protein